MDDEFEAVRGREPDDAFDKVLRYQLRWEAPPMLTASLLALVPGAPMPVLGPLFMLRPQPKRWYVVLVSVLTALAVMLSLLVAWQFYGSIGAELGLPEMWRALWEAPGIGLARLFEVMPQAAYLLSIIEGVRSYLYWLLLVAVLWVALDGWTPGFTLRRQQTS